MQPNGNARHENPTQGEAAEGEENAEVEENDTKKRKTKDPKKNDLGVKIEP